MCGKAPAVHPPILVPSLLAGDHAHLADSAGWGEKLGLPWLHLDIMDGHFVPNFTFGPELLAALRRNGSKLYFDTHLMLNEPDRYVEAFAKAGASNISIHVEPDYDHAATLARIRALNCQCGIVLNPGTPARTIEPLLPLVDLVLVMTVQPGFGGQSFRRDMLPKLTQLASSFPCEVWMVRNNRRINAKSIMGVMMLAAGKGSKVLIETEGERADEAMQAILTLIADKFGEGE